LSFTEHHPHLPDSATLSLHDALPIYYRLKVFPINLPPLRDREGDIDTLAQYFLQNLNKREGTQKRLAPATFERLRNHSWPGNVRDRKSTRLNSSHVKISYAVFCLKKK